MKREICKKKGQRYDYLDTIRGITLFSMILYHTVWDMVYMYGTEWNWFYGRIAYFWQQSICFTFILLSGFCWSMGHKRIKRGLVVFLSGILISFVTKIFVPENQVVFGILTFLGTSMLLLSVLNRIAGKIPVFLGTAVSVGSFLVTKNINRGYIGFGMIRLIEIPEKYYHKGLAMTFLGFTDRSFSSADYFSIFPWFFLFMTGYFLYRTAAAHGLLEIPMKWNWRKVPFTSLGCHSLAVYLFHQPVIYLILSIFYGTV